MLSYYVINLNSATDRLDFQVRQFAALGLHFSRVPAVSVSELCGDDIVRLVFPRCSSVLRKDQLLRQSAGRLPEIFLPEHKRYLKAEEVACYLSHEKALRNFLDSAEQVAVVLEDDAALNPKIDQFVKALAPKFGYPYVIKMEGVHLAKGRPCIRVGKYAGVRVVAPAKPAAGSAAYLITRSAAELLLSRMFPIREPYDLFLRQYWRHGMCVLGTRPFLVTQQHDLDSSIPSRRLQQSPERTRTQKGLIALLRFWIKVQHAFGRLLFIQQGLRACWAWRDR